MHTVPTLGEKEGPRIRNLGGQLLHLGQRRVRIAGSVEQEHVALLLRIEIGPHRLPREEDIGEAIAREILAAPGVVVDEMGFLEGFVDGGFGYDAGPVAEVLDRLDPVQGGEQLRFFLLRGHYRSELAYTRELLDDAGNTLRGFYTALREVPAAYHPRTVAEGKKIRAVSAGLHALWVIVKTRFWD